MQQFLLLWYLPQFSVFVFVFLIFIVVQLQLSAFSPRPSVFGLPFLQMLMVLQWFECFLWGMLMCFNVYFLLKLDLSV